MLAIPGISDCSRHIGAMRLVATWMVPDDDCLQVIPCPSAAQSCCDKLAV